MRNRPGRCPIEYAVVRRHGMWGGMREYAVKAHALSNLRNLWSTLLHQNSTLFCDRRMNRAKFGSTFANQGRIRMIHQRKLLGRCVAIGAGLAAASFALAARYIPELDELTWSNFTASGASYSVTWNPPDDETFPKYCLAFNWSVASDGSGSCPGTNADVTWESDEDEQSDWEHSVCDLEGTSASGTYAIPLAATNVLTAIIGVRENGEKVNGNRSSIPGPACQ